MIDSVRRYASCQNKSCVMVPVMFQPYTAVIVDFVQAHCPVKPKLCLLAFTEVTFMRLRLC